MWCPVLQWKHPGLQLRWTQVRTPLPEPPEPDQAERRLGRRQATGGVAASRRAWAVAGRTAAGAWAHFFIMHEVNEIDAARSEKVDKADAKVNEKAGGAPVPSRARPVGGSTATGRVRTGDLCDDS